jgi:SHS2 domain-containing protein
MNEPGAAPDGSLDSSAPFDLLEHPGDLKLRVRGATLEQLFTRAAEGTMSYLFGSQITNAALEGTEHIETRSSDREALLVDWLSELLYRATTEYGAYAGFRIDELSEQRLRATLRLGP